MLRVTVPKRSFYDEEKEVFVDVPEQELEMEHSLKSVSKWESITHKPFLSSKGFKPEEMLLYMKCMCQNDVPDTVWEYLDEKTIMTIQAYMTDSHTATTVNDKNKKPSRDIITTELIYYWMTELNIPFECENWNFSRLMTLITVCTIKKGEQNGGGKKMSRNDALSQQAALNQARRAKMHSKG